MILTPRIEKAIKKAAALHKDQSRKGEDKCPYITHPYSVAIILSNYTEDEDVIVAGLLHDTIEDTKYTLEELEKDFGAQVKEIVVGVTEIYMDDDDKNKWENRKQRYLNNLREANDKSVLVSAADKLHNLRSLVGEYKNNGAEMWENLAMQPEKQMWFLGEVLIIFKDRLTENNIVSEFEAVYNEALVLFRSK